MPWFKVDDAFHGHPKVLELSLPAVGLWALAGSWCANYLTDGEITLRAIGRLGGSDKHAQELVDAGLWIPTDDESYQFKDWHDYQPLKSEIEAERDAARERMKTVRAKRKLSNKGGSSSEPSEDVQANNSGTFADDSEEVRLTPTQPSPAQPAPSHPTPPKGGVKPATRGARIREDFQVTQQMREWAAAKAPNADLGLETEKFINYYVALSGPKATKLDWVATWRNWMLNAKGSQPRMDHSARGIARGMAMMQAWDAKNPDQNSFLEIEV